MFDLNETFWSNVFFTVVNILILYVVLKKLLFKPVTAFMKNRSDKIQEAIDTANSTKDEVEGMKLQYQERLKSAGEEGKKIIEEHKVMAASEYSSAMAVAKKDAQQIIDDARREIEVEKEKAISDLKKEVGDLVIVASEKVVKKNMDNETNRKIVSEFIDDAGVA